MFPARPGVRVSPPRIIDCRMIRAISGLVEGMHGLCNSPRLPPSRKKGYPPHHFRIEVTEWSNACSPGHPEALDRLRYARPGPCFRRELREDLDVVLGWCPCTIVGPTPLGPGYVLKTRQSSAGCLLRGSGRAGPSPGPSPGPPSPVRLRTAGWASLYRPLASRPEETLSEKPF